MFPCSLPYPALCRYTKPSCSQDSHTLQALDPVEYLCKLKVLFYLLFFPIGDDWAENFPLVIGCRCENRSKSPYAPLITGIIVTGMIVTPLTLVAGGILSPRNGKYEQSTNHISLIKQA